MGVERVVFCTAVDWTGCYVRCDGRDEQEIGRGLNRVDCLKKAVIVLGLFEK